MVRIPISILIVLMTFHIAFGQRGVEIGGHLGGSMYFGDLNNSFSFKLPGVTAGGDLRYNFNERLSVKGGLNYVFIRGNDNLSDNLFEKARNLSFRNHMGELSGQVELNFLSYTHGSRDNWYTPYLFLGGSVVAHSPSAKYQGTWYKLRELGTEGQKKGSQYGIMAGNWLFGLGMKLDLSTEWSLNVDLCSRQSFSDYLDDVSKEYVNSEQIRINYGDVAAALADPSILIPGYNDAKIGVDGRQRGDKSRKDGYTTFTIGIMYYFGQVRCPDILSH